MARNLLAASQNEAILAIGTAADTVEGIVLVAHCSTPGNEYAIEIERQGIPSTNTRADPNSRQKIVHYAQGPLAWK